MKLLEHEAKKLLKKHSLPVPHSQIVQAPAKQTSMEYPVVLKAQIPKGGRGQAGGVLFIKNDHELAQSSKALFTKPLLGCTVRSLLIEEALAIKYEFYLAITFDRQAQTFVLLAHNMGGVDIEKASKQTPPLRVPITGSPNTKTIQQVGHHFALEEHNLPHLSAIIKNLWQTCTQEDALLVEINPLVFTKQGDFVCTDAKIELDDAAAFRHDWHFEAKPASTQFVILHKEGTVASMANGAGLAMATIDAIEAAGGLPANFFDVGGGTNVAGMVAAFEKMAELPDVKAIVVNIFGGITRCDEVAEAIITATKTVKNLPKLFIRLTGTNEAEGQALLHKTGIATLPTLAACVEAAVNEVNNV